MAQFAQNYFAGRLRFTAEECEFKQIALKN